MDPLTGDSTSLREFRLDDLDDYLAIVGDDRVTNWLSFDSRDRAAAQRALATTVRLGPTGVRAAHLGYAIAADHWGHGYATDACRTMLRFAFETLELHRVSAAIGPENLASIAVVKRLGFTYEGRIRHHVFTNGAWRDSLLYSLLTDEWSASAGS
jgi:ribosomal-protein-alanine N-acetyltransferase